MARVLHIEDDPRNRLLVRKLLSGDGHEVIDAADGLEGVRLAIAQRPDIVLVDLNIPGLDGFEVTLRLRTEASLNGVPIVAITAEGDRDTSFAVGCDGFLQKPIDARNFARQVASYIGGRRERMMSSPDVAGDRLRIQSGRIVAHLEEKVAELSTANERLREVEKLRTEFYRNISHELATPLTPIVGYLRMMMDEELGETNKAQRKALRAMDDCIRRLRSTLDNLIDVTGLETGKMRFFHKDYDFLDTVRRAIAWHADAVAERKLTMLEEFPRGPLPGYGDSDRLGRAMSQLIDNAIKFTPEGGIVGVMIRPGDTAYELVVADTGSGIQKERAERIFEPFYQVDGSATRSFGGTGVGLAIARRVARGLGGEVRLLPEGASIEGMFLGGAAFSLSVAKRAPTVILDAGGRLSARVYLDWNATTPPREEVLAAIDAAARTAWANPSSIHADGRAARAAVEDARAAVAALTGVSPRDVTFTAGGTEANNLALRSLASAGTTLVTSRLEHPSITRVADALEREGRVTVRWLAVTTHGTIDLEDLERALAEPGAVSVVTVQAVNHETGVIQPVADVVSRAHARGAMVHVDAVQGWGKIDVPAGWDSATVAAHKIRGPKGIGALVAREGVRIDPVLLGGAQEKGIRPGTVAPALAAGFRVAAALASPARWAKIAPLRDRLEAALLALDPPVGIARVAGDRALRAPHVTNLLWPGWIGAELVAALDLEGVSVSSGAACSAGTVEPSPVLTAMLGAELGARGVRLSLGDTTTETDVDRAVAAFRAVLPRRS